VFGPILESSRPLSTCIRSLHDGRESAPGSVPWRGCLTRSFHRWHRLPSRSNEVNRLASPYIGLCWGTRPSCGGAAWSCCDGASREEDASWCIVISWWLCPLLVPAHELL
jgi:hypothetical protein